MLVSCQWYVNLKSGEKGMSNYYTGFRYEEKLWTCGLIPTLTFVYWDFDEPDLDEYTS